jgi:hypothetical protein
MADAGCGGEPSGMGRPARRDESDAEGADSSEDSLPDRRSVTGRLSMRTGRTVPRLVFVLWAVALPLVYLDQPLHFDEGIFLTVGRRIEMGETLYVDVADHKPPGIYLLAAGIYTLIDAPIVAARLVTYGVTAVSGLLVVRLARPVCDRRLAYAAGALFVIISSLPHFDGYHFVSEPYAVITLLAAAVLLGGVALRSHVAAGVALGVGVLFNQTVLLFGAVILLVAVLRLRRPDRRTAPAIKRSVLEVLAIGVGFLAVVGVAAVTLATQGLLEDAFYYAVRLPAANYSTPFDARGHAFALAAILPVWLLAAGMVGRTAVAVGRGETVHDRLLFATVWAAVLSVPGAVGFAGDHKFLFAFPALSLLAIVGAEQLYGATGGVRRLGRALRGGRPDRASLVAGLLLAVVVGTAAVAGAGNVYVTIGMVQQDVDDSRAVLESAVDGLEGPIYAYNVQAQLYVHTDVAPGTQYLGTMYTDGIARRKVAALERKDVRYVLVKTNFVEDERVVPGAYWSDSKSIMTAYLNDHYEPMRTTGEWVVFERTERRTDGDRATTAGRDLRPPRRVGSGTRAGSGLDASRDHRLSTA